MQAPPPQHTLMIPQAVGVQTTAWPTEAAGSNYSAPALADVHLTAYLEMTQPPTRRQASLTPAAARTTSLYLVLRSSPQCISLPM